MNDNREMRHNCAASRAGWLTFSLDVLLLLHVFVAIGFAVLRLGAGFAGGGTGRPSQMDDLFFRRALRIRDAIKFGWGAGSGSGFSYPDCCEPPGLLGGVAYQFTFLASCMCLAILAAVAARVFVPAKVSRVILHPLVAAAGLLGWLTCWWHVSLAVPKGGWLMCSYSPPIWLAWLFVVVTSIIGYGALRWRRSTWMALLIYGGVFMLHAGFWLVTVAHRVFWLPLLLPSAAVAIGGVCWLARENRLMRGVSSPESRGIGKRCLCIVAMVSLGLLLLIWLPPGSYQVSGTRESGHLVIRLQRGGGMGATPAYSITVYGDGKVVYSGDRMVAVTGSQTAFIQPDRVQKLAARFDRIDFFGLENRTFAMCPDVQTALVEVSTDVRKKTILSAVCPDLATKPQADVLRIAQEIDNTVRSDQWTRCDGPCLR